MRRFDLDEKRLPALATVQRFVGNYKKHHLSFNDYHDLIEDKVRNSVYTGEEEDSVGFTFSGR